MAADQTIIQKPAALHQAVRHWPLLSAPVGRRGFGGIRSIAPVKISRNQGIAVYALGCPNETSRNKSTNRYNARDLANLWLVTIECMRFLAVQERDPDSDSKDGSDSA